MKIVIAGASGLIGGHVVNKLHQQIEHQVIAITRKPLAVFAPHKNMVVEWDSFPISDLQAEIFVCCLGTTIKAAGSEQNFIKVDFEYVKKFAELAKRSHVEKFILISASGANKNSKIFYNRIKGQVEEVVKGYTFPGLAILRPSLLIGDRIEKRPAEKLAQIILPHFDFLLRGSLKKYQTISASLVADAVSWLALNQWNGTHIIESDKLKVEKFSI